MSNHPQLAEKSNNVLSNCSSRTHSYKSWKIKKDIKLSKHSINLLKQCYREGEGTGGGGGGGRGGLGVGVGGGGGGGGGLGRRRTPSLRLVNGQTNCTGVGLHTSSTESVRSPHHHLGALTNGHYHNNNHPRLNKDDSIKISIENTNTCTDSLVTALDDETLLITDFLGDTGQYISLYCSKFKFFFKLKLLMCRYTKPNARVFNAQCMTQRQNLTRKIFNPVRESRVKWEESLLSRATVAVFLLLALCQATASTIHLESKREEKKAKAKILFMKFICLQFTQN